MQRHLISVMIILAETAAESERLSKRLRSLAYNLGPGVSLIAILSSGKQIRYSGGTTLPARCQTLIERIETNLLEHDKA